MRTTKIMTRTTRFLILVVLRLPTYGSNVATLESNEEYLLNAVGFNSALAMLNAVWICVTQVSSRVMKSTGWVGSRLALQLTIEGAFR